MMRMSNAKEHVLLRSLLRHFPSWAAGHVRLGYLEVLAQLNASGKLDPRSIATIRISAEAARRLLYKKTSCATSATFLETFVLMGMEAFLSGRYREALRDFEDVLQPERAMVLPKKFYDLAVEYAGASALAMEDRERALALFLKIPKKQRSQEIVAAIDMLRAVSPQP